MQHRPVSQNCDDAENVYRSPSRVPEVLGYMVSSVYRYMVVPRIVPYTIGNVLCSSLDRSVYIAEAAEGKAIRVIILTIVNLP